MRFLAFVFPAFNLGQDLVIPNVDIHAGAPAFYLQNMVIADPVVATNGLAGKDAIAEFSSLPIHLSILGEDLAFAISEYSGLSAPSVIESIDIGQLFFDRFLVTSGVDEYSFIESVEHEGLKKIASAAFHKAGVVRENVGKEAYAKFIGLWNKALGS